MDLSKGLLEPLEPYKASVGNVAAVVTIAQFLAGSLVCWNIVKNKSTENVDCVPFVGGIVNGILTLQGSFLNNDTPTFICSVVAVVLYTIYTLVYVLYSCNWKEEVCQPLAVGVAILAVILGYTQYEDPQLLPWRFGLIVTVLALAVLGSPLLSTQEMLKKGDASAIQMPLAASSAVVCFLWLLYGILDENTFMTIQNMVGFLLAAVQVGLKIIYPGREGTTSRGTNTT